MPEITPKQRDAVAMMAADYGQPDRISIEGSEGEVGLVRMQWFEGGNDPFGRRSLYIKPNGERLVWHTIGGS